MGRLILYILLLTACISACKKNDANNARPYAFNTPAGWPAPVQPVNTITLEGVELGRALFYETALSADGSISCASCHEQRSAFGTYDHDLSHGYNNSHTIRNAPPLQNLAWKKLYGWDGAHDNLQKIILHHLDSKTDMGGDLSGALKRLQQNKKYQDLNAAAFNVSAISAQHITQALEMFLLTLISANSKYDLVQQGKASFNLPEQLGLEIFNTKCAACHALPLTSDNSFRNIGLPFNAVLNDAGRMEVTKMPADSLKFMVPSLRNVIASHPYTHDGRIKDIYAMLQHYNSGVVNAPGTDQLVRNRIPLSNFEQGQLVAFMLALSDSGFIHNADYKPR